MPKQHIFFILLVSFVMGCNPTAVDQAAAEEALKPRSEGHPGELLVVMTREQAKSVYGDAVNESFLETPYIITPQREPVFTLIIKTPEQYRKYFKLYRNVLKLNIGQTENHKTPKIKVYRDLEARDQLVFEIFAESRTQAAEFLKSKKQSIIDIIETKEIDRLQNDPYARYNQSAMTMLESDYGIKLSVPLGYIVAEKRPDFVWLKTPKRQLEQDVTDNTIIANQDIALDKSILIYTYPYEDDSTFTPKFLMAKRDSVMKYNVPGKTKDTYLGTEYGYGVEPRYAEITHQGEYAVEIKGIWRLVNGFMGGPFVSLTAVDKKTNRVVTVEGYVYAPHDKKREYIRSLEAVVKSMSFVEQ